MEDINCYWACSFVQFSWDSIFSWCLIRVHLWMAFMISRTDGRWSSSSTVGCWGIWSGPVALTDEGLFSKLLKCSAHHSLKASRSFFSFDPSADSKGVGPDHVDPYTVFRTLKNFLELFESAYFCTSYAFLSHIWSFILWVTSGFVLWDVWICLPWIWSLGYFATPHRPGSLHVAAKQYICHSHWTNPDVHIS